MKKLVVPTILGLSACLWSGSGRAQSRFIDDVEFMQKHTELVVLSDEAGQAQVAVAPGYQAKVMTSTAAGPEGLSFGWINRDTIASGTRKPHINVFGGEDRLWLGPEGGQFSLYYPKDAAFDMDHWQVPEPLDWGPWDVVSKDSDEVRFAKEMELTNYSGATFRLLATRTVRLLGPRALKKSLDQKPGANTKVVAYESENMITNLGKNTWDKQTGMPSIWILGMYNPSPQTTVVIPYLRGPVEQLGPVVTDDYFGKVPADRLVDNNDGALFFKADGKHRGKIGVAPLRVKDRLGSYDAKNQVLTIVQFTFPTSPYNFDYVNSAMKIQEKPFAGDVVNSYNDGPASPGAKPLGPFYELESSSPAAALAPGKSLTHVHRTLHLQGPEEELDPIARKLFGVSLEAIKTALK
jgi:hypothetical protein